MGRSCVPDGRFDCVDDLGDPPGTRSMRGGLVRWLGDELIGDYINVVLSFSKELVVGLVGGLPGVCEAFWSSLWECLTSKFGEGFVVLVYVENSCRCALAPM